MSIFSTRVCIDEANLPTFLPPPRSLGVAHIARFELLCNPASVDPAQYESSDACALLLSLRGLFELEV
jgi:hypothetical protein